MSRKSSLILRKETLPVRCEICHQTDLFKPETGICERCQGVASASPVTNESPADVPRAAALRWRIRVFRPLALGALLVGGVLALVGDHYCRFPDRSHGGELPGLADEISGLMFCIGAVLIFLLASIWGGLWASASWHWAQYKKQFLQGNRDQQ
ncbi:MAG: hypothetical protein K1Y36_14305 [Blastocatellia bacterium]|nr:hypothetical protein [Blastocatellia bacterium]